MSNDAIFVGSIFASFAVLFVICYVLIRSNENEQLLREKHDWARGYTDAKAFHKENGRSADGNILLASQAYVNGWSDYQQTSRIVEEARFTS